MPDDKCPWCGAGVRKPQYGSHFWACYTKVGGEEPDRSSPCLRREKDQIAARVARLEAVLRHIASGGVTCGVQYVSDHETLARHYYPTLIAAMEDAARDALANG